MRRLLPVIVAFWGGAGSIGHAAAVRIPVIYDTDIGADIDDTWALGFILASPELDLKLVVSDSHNALSKAAIIAKFLERAGRGHIPVGIGIQCDDRADAQDPWARGYDLSRYPGKVHRDGVQAIIDVIMRHPEPPVTLLAVGPVPNIAEALKREPRIAERARFATRFGEEYDTDRFSSTLFDTLAVYLVWDQAVCNMEDIRFRITDRGHTLADAKGKIGHVALTWKDQPAFHKLLADRIAKYRP